MNCYQSFVIISLRVLLHENKDRIQYSNENEKKKTHQNLGIVPLCNLLLLDFLRQSDQPALAPTHPP